ncbi:hypothetical protein RB653_002567 [Dictyostelium firmibasis]|uniref:Uncharacterized protein n=1 Tax=Dictyostelium firmibasis TaxID=79012 RepID=A0AAN7YN51_9MYCE
MNESITKDSSEIKLPTKYLNTDKSIMNIRSFSEENTRVFNGIELSDLTIRDVNSMKKELLAEDTICIVRWYLKSQSMLATVKKQVDVLQKQLTEMWIANKSLTQIQSQNNLLVRSFFDEKCDILVDLKLALRELKDLKIENASLKNGLINREKELLLKENKEKLLGIRRISSKGQTNNRSMGSHIKCDDSKRLVSVLKEQGPEKFYEYTNFLYRQHNIDEEFKVDVLKITIFGASENRECMKYIHAIEHEAKLKGKISWSDIPEILERWVTPVERKRYMTNELTAAALIVTNKGYYGPDFISKFISFDKLYKNDKLEKQKELLLNSLPIEIKRQIHIEFKSIKLKKEQETITHWINVSAKVIGRFIDYHKEESERELKKVQLMKNNHEQG